MRIVLGWRLQAVNALLLRGVSEEEKLIFMRTMQKIAANLDAWEETESE